MRSQKNIITGFFVLLMLLNIQVTSAQEFERVEPELQAEIEATSPYSKGLKNGMALNIELNDFGVALGGQYRRGISFNNELLLDVTITALKDEREQQFQNFFGQQIIPNKYQRVLAFPVTVGIKRRFFAQQLSDDFRVYTQASVGGVIAYAYPYFDDFADQGFIGDRQFPNDVFQGLGDGSWETGISGQFGIGIDFGSEFKRFQSVRFAYVFHYFPDGIQVMEPNSPNPAFDGFEKQNYFGTPTINLKFGGMW